MRRVRHAPVRYGVIWWGEARFGMAVLACLGRFRRDLVRSVMIWCGRAALVWLARLWRVGVWSGWAGKGAARLACRGKARPGRDWSGEVGRGVAWLDLLSG